MAESDTEKASPPTHSEHPPTDELELDLDEIGETTGYVVDVSQIQDKALVERLKLASDGRTILIPQPSEDPNDPLNWSWFKKHLILVIISATAFLPDYGSATGAVALIPQAK
jgi:hypothetical protein